MLPIEQPGDPLTEVDATHVMRVCEMMCRLVRCSSEQEFLRELPGAARDLLDADTAWVALIAGQEIVLKTQSGLRRSDIAQRWRMKLGEGITGAVADDGKPRLIRDYLHDPRRALDIKRVVDDEGLRGGLCVPVYRGKTIIGALMVASYQVDRYDVGEMKVLVAFMALAHRVAESIQMRMTEVFGRVKAESDLSSLRDADAVELAMAEEIASEGGIGRALVWLAQWLDAPVSLRDKAGHVLAAAGHVDDESGTRIALVGEVDNELDLLIHDNGGMTPLQREACAGCAAIVTMAVLRERSRFQAELRIRSELFDELLDGRIANAQDMILRSALVGIDLDVPRVVVCVTVRGSAADNDVLAPRLVAKVQKYMLDHVRGGAATIRGGRLALLLTAPENASLDDRLSIGTHLLDNMRPYIDINQLAIGVGRVCQDLDDYKYSFNEADITSRQIAQGKLDRNVAVVEELGLYGILAMSTGSRSLERLVTEKLGPLLEADEASRSEYIKTLRAYFENDRHLERTARALFVHVNTLRYRLERIQEHLGVDLRDSRNRFLVELAVYADTAVDGGDQPGPSDALDETSITKQPR